MKKIRVLLNSGDHSKGRGVGVYADNLQRALIKHKEIELVETKPDIVHYPFFDLFYSTLPMRKKKPTVVTIHDLTPLVMADRYPKGVKGSLNLLHQRAALRNVSAIITDSENSKKDLIKYFHLPSKKVFVTRLGVSPDYFARVTPAKMAQVKDKYGLPNKFVLTSAGGPNPNKNLPALAEVTKKLNLPLVIFGRGLVQELPEGKVHPELQDLVKLKTYEHLILPGFVPSEDVVALYKLATLYCQPSLYEGFGLPLLEAMAAGCLIVSSSSSSLPEIYPAGTITFDPKDLLSMEEAISKALSLTTKEKGQHIEQGIAHASRFTWEKTAKETITVYQKIISKRV